MTTDKKTWIKSDALPSSSDNPLCLFSFFWFRHEIHADAAEMP